MAKKESILNRHKESILNRHAGKVAVAGLVFWIIFYYIPQSLALEKYDEVDGMVIQLLGGTRFSAGAVVVESSKTGRITCKATSLSAIGTTVKVIRYRRAGGWAGYVNDC